MLMPSIFRTNVFDDFFEDPFKDFARVPARPQNELMRTDVKELENGFELSIALPGVKKEDITAEINDGYLTISATTSTNKDEKNADGKYIRRERFYGSAKRSFYVGEDITEEESAERDSTDQPREASMSVRTSQRKISRLSMKTVS